MKHAIGTQLASASLIVLLALHAPVHAQDAAGAIQQMLELSMKDKKGLNIYANGQSLAGVVVKIEAGQWVEMRSQQFGRIVVRTERIDAVAMQ